MAELVLTQGKAAPRALVSVFVYSPLPLLFTTTAGANGAWRYDPAQRLNDGRHTAYAAINDGSGNLTAASAPTSFFVRDGEVVSEAEFLKPDMPIASAPAVPPDVTRWFLIGGIALAFILLMLTVWIVVQARRNRISQPVENGSGGNL